jgi:hypothetical protein
MFPRNTEEQGPHGRPEHQWNDDIKMELKMGLNGINWHYLLSVESSGKLL